MKKGITYILLITTIIIAAVFVGGTILTIKTIKAETTSTQNETIEQIECEHEFVITSKYNWWLDKYKTISKCVKCGKEI